MGLRAFGARGLAHPVTVSETEKWPGLAVASRLRPVADALFAERERWALWIPVGLGVGIGTYFTLGTEPAAWLGGAVAALAVALVAVTAMGRFRAALPLAAALLAVAGGFAVAQWRTFDVAAPVLADRVGPVGVEGRVVLVEAAGKGRRLTLDRVRIDRLDPEATPASVRVRVHGGAPEIAPGAWIRTLAILSPPSAPAAPGAFDFQRQSWFRELGGIGFGLGRPQVLARDGGDGFAVRVAALRLAIGARIDAAVQAPRAGVARALMTGDRGEIPEPVLDALRDSGLAHLLAISGLHVGLVAGIVFFGVRAALALAPPLALRRPIKKWAAAVAVAAALAYALVAGATVPTQRAFLMIGLVLLAVMVDRRGLTVRSVAMAASVILLLRPESLLDASFQLSFAAVTALIAVYEVFRTRRASEYGPLGGVAARAAAYVGGVALTTLVAGMATAPFAVFHFNRVAAFGLVANLGAVPVTALWIMPWGVVAALAMPFGLESMPLAAMGWGIEVVIRIAGTVAAWPGAAAPVPAMPTWGLVTMALGGLWLCLWRRPWRLAGLAGIAIGLASLPLARPPDLLVDDAGELLAVRDADGELTFSTLKAGRFDREIWLRRAGQDEEPSAWPKAGATPDGRLACDSVGCIHHAAGHVVALVRRSEALADDCAVADVVVSLVPVRRCPSARTIIDRFDLAREGAHALWFGESGVRVESVNGLRGRRPWVPKRGGDG